MLIYERSVTKPFQQVLREYVNRRLNTDRFESVGNTGVRLVYGGECTCAYAILRDHEPVAWLYLGRRPKWKAWEVRQIFVDPAYRGQGMAARIYRAAVNEHGLILASGKSQTKTSRALWFSFVKKNTFNIWAQDFNDLDLRSLVWCEDGELQSDIEIYTRYSSKHDVRLIAIRK